ncbi:MAG TPA: serine/threonine-protein kinase [Gemmatimonadales bacterium]|nr:serine/threonine-protein kinase [Gemmatimonadales bacterium]
MKGHPTRSMPDDLLEESRKRIGVAGLVIAAIWFVIVAFMSVAWRFFAASVPNVEAIWPMPGRYFAIAGILGGLGLALVARQVGPRSHWLRDAAALLMVGTCLMLAVLESRVPVTQPGRLSWVNVIILLYPLIVTDSPRRTLVVSLVAAFTVPAALLMARLRGVALPPETISVVVLMVPPFLCAAIAVLPAGLIRQLGQAVKRAREIGAYRLGKLLGEGGMGQVYYATHQLLARPAAVKLIRAESIKGVSSDTARTAMERFRREAAAAAMLNSPHTIALYDFGPTGDGSFFYAMELLEGMSLEDMVQRFGPLPQERVVYFLRQACLSLAEAHRRSLIHRDIKPSNLFACRAGIEVDFLKVLDFGLVKEAAPASPEQVKLTAVDALTGTPAFMAPELALGDADFDQRVDIYALGCTAYWLLTGDLPFYATNTVQMLFKQANEPAPTPSAKSKHPILPAVDAAVLACLAKVPGDRPKDAPALIAMLDAIQFEAPWTPVRAAAWWDEHLPAKLLPTPADTGRGDRGEWIRFLKESQPK